MISSMFNPVDRISTSTCLSTADAILKKLFMLDMRFQDHLQTWFASSQVIDLKVENRLVHTNKPVLSTIAIDL
jgi:hypothetical protein